MAALDFPSSPTIGQTATLTNGITYQWDGAVWATAASTGQAAGGDLSGTYPNPQIAAGAVVNADVNASAAIAYSKLAGGGVASGDLTGSYPNPTVAKLGQDITQFGVRGGVQNDWSKTLIWTNESGMPGFANSIWSVMLEMRANEGDLHFYMRPIGGGAVRDMMGINNDGSVYLNYYGGKTNCTLADGRVTRVMTQAGTPIGAYNHAYISAFTLTAYDVWTTVTSFPLTTRGGVVFLVANHGISYNSLGTAKVKIGSRWVRDGSQVLWGYFHDIADTLTNPLPPSHIIDYNCPAGAHTFYFQVYLNAGSSASFTASGWDAYIQGQEIS